MVWQMHHGCQQAQIQILTMIDECDEFSLIARLTVRVEDQIVEYL
eukprot:SAG31_NODE_5179_length_2697_cov_2.142802_1_plen_44_part_10